LYVRLGTLPLAVLPGAADPPAVVGALAGVEVPAAFVLDFLLPQPATATAATATTAPDESNLDPMNPPLSV
jgi:hypothetical protein